MKVFGDSFTFMGDHLHLMVHKSGLQLQYFLIAFAIAFVVAVPLGVWLGHKHRGSFAAINISNVGRALPPLAIIAMSVAVIGIGTTPLLLALVIIAIPPMLTNAYVAVDSVDRDVVDAARGVGYREIEILTKVELPLALPLVFAGMRTAVLYIIATIPLGAVAGSSGGLGDIVADQATYGTTGQIASAIWIAALAFILDTILAFLQRALTPVGLKLRDARDESVAVTTQQARSAVTV